MDVIYQEPKICKVCGKVFTHGEPRALTCSPECSKANKKIMAKLRENKYDTKQYYLNRQEAKKLCNRRPNPFGTFESFEQWAKKMLKGGVVKKYSKRG